MIGRGTKFDVRDLVGQHLVPYHQARGQMCERLLCCVMSLDDQSIADRNAPSVRAKAVTPSPSTPNGGMEVESFRGNRPAGAWGGKSADPAHY